MGQSTTTRGAMALVFDSYRTVPVTSDKKRLFYFSIFNGSGDLKGVKAQSLARGHSSLVVNPTFSDKPLYVRLLFAECNEKCYRGADNVYLGTFSEAFQTTLIDSYLSLRQQGIVTHSSNLHLHVSSDSRPTDRCHES